MRKKPGVELRTDVKEVVERLWPDGVIEMPGDLEDSWFWAVHKKLKSAFGRFGGARPLIEREGKGGPVWWEMSDPEEDPPDECEHTRTYHLFFISPKGKAFTFETEAIGLEEPEEFEESGWQDLRETTVSGSGHTGWSVAVSLLVPFAVITLGEVETFDDGSTTDPVIETAAQTLEGEPITDPEEHFRKSEGDQAYQILLKLRGKIVDTLGRYGISVLPQEEWRKVVPWLRGGDEVFVGQHGKPVRVLDALFFEGL